MSEPSPGLVDMAGRALSKVVHRTSSVGVMRSLNWFSAVTVPTLALLAYGFRDLAGTRWMILSLIGLIVLTWLATFIYSIIRRPASLQSEEHQQSMEYLNMVRVTFAERALSAREAERLGVVIMRHRREDGGDTHGE